MTSEGSVQRQEAARPGRRLAGPAALLALLLATAAAYADALRGELQFDDDQFVTSDLAIRDLGRLLREELLPGLLHGRRVVVQATFAADYAVGRLDPLPYHATNLLVHLAAVVLAFLLARDLLRCAGHPRAAGVALAAAALFALHPLQTQAVTYVWQRSESLAALCYLAALLLLRAA